MTPTLVHRYAFPVREAIEALLGDAAGDAEAWRIRVEGDELVIDIVAPASASTMDASADTMDATQGSPAPEPERKGGPLARRAAMICQEGGFRAFSETNSIEEAADWLREACAINSRADLDHEAVAAELFEKIDGRYRRWLQGYDD